MRLTNRLARLEARVKPVVVERDPDVCPPGRDPVVWALRRRTDEMFDQFMRGDRVVPPPGTTQEEIDWIVGTLRVIDVFYAGRPEEGRCVPREIQQAQLAVRAALDGLGALSTTDPRGTSPGCWSS